MRSLEGFSSARTFPPAPTEHVVKAAAVVDTIRHVRHTSSLIIDKTEPHSSHGREREVCFVRSSEAEVETPHQKTQQ